jgi:hypothetical protein
VSPSAVGVAVPQVLRVVSTVVAPTTLITALLIYFGRLHATGYFRYFGVNYTVFDLSTQDYLVRATDGMFVPLGLAAAVVLLTLWVHRGVVGAASPETRVRLARQVMPLVAVAGLLLLLQAGAVLRDWGPWAGRDRIGGVSLAAGVLLLVMAAHQVRGLPGAAHEPPGSPLPGAAAIAEWTAAFVLVSAGLFWAVGAHALQIGAQRGAMQAARLAQGPDLVVYADQRLHLSAAGVRETVCQGEEPGFRYRYDGLKVGLRLGGQLFVLPASWNRSDGAALVLPRTDGVRLEFAPPGQVLPETC